MPFSNCFFIGFYFTLLWERRTQTNAARRITPGGGGCIFLGTLSSLWLDSTASERVKSELRLPRSAIFVQISGA